MEYWASGRTERKTHPRSVSGHPNVAKHILRISQQGLWLYTWGGSGHMVGVARILQYRRHSRVSYVPAQISYSDGEVDPGWRVSLEVSKARTVSL